MVRLCKLILFFLCCFSRVEVVQVGNEIGQYWDIFVVIVYCFYSGEVVFDNSLQGGDGVYVGGQIGQIVYVFVGVGDGELVSIFVMFQCLFYEGFVEVVSELVWGNY